MQVSGPRCAKEEVAAPSAKTAASATAAAYFFMDAFIMVLRSCLIAHAPTDTIVACMCNAQSFDSAVSNAAQRNSEISEMHNLATFTRN
jgi:hypothetical protein